MTDSVTNVEIEDVLSSIRRLVSQDTRTQARTQAHQAADKLVLTPALRVAEAPDAGAPDATVDERDTAVDEHAHRDETGAQFGDRVPEDIASGPTQSRGDETPLSQGRDAAADDDWDDGYEFAFAEESEASDLDALTALVNQEVFRALEQGIAEQNAASQDEAMPSDEDEDQPEIADGASADAADEAATRDAENELADLLAGDDAVEADGDEEPAGDAPETAARKSAGDESLATKIARLEEMVGRTADDEEYEDARPEEGGNAAFRHRPVRTVGWDDSEPQAEEPSEDVAQADAGRESGPQIVAETVEAVEPVETVEPDEDQTWGEAALLRDDVPVIDEDMLRDMVAEIVRQELQGALGERITRNVRKLVRREIHRVLMSQDFG
ncbi:hypothetical protein KUH32_02305 [Thalassococcus sp. CAU 1522]|uniref:Glycerol-3-phosphate dehydrogenase n=1 Tax=Thalassococcus arenae TaxID=2851652 RepID=A0ABS6N3J3_9RHOB|nr:hypothetical protein [Thalassococcus arenae]MBV2358593.1 hypothetical protein [Thalassococcus arenae]